VTKTAVTTNHQQNNNRNRNLNPSSTKRLKLKNKNTHTTKKYAIDCIQQLREEAIEKVNSNKQEPNLEEYKLKAVKNGKATFKATSLVKQEVNKTLKNSRYYGGYGNTAIKIVDLVDTPADFTKAHTAWKRAKPAQNKKIHTINTAYETAERTIMLGGSDTVIGEAIAKLETALSSL